MPSIDESAIRRILEENLEPSVAKSVIDGASFKDAGVDSLDLSAILYDVATEAGAEFSDEQVAAMNSVDDIVAFFNA